MRSIVEATSWMDWWTFSVKSLALKSSSDARLVHRLSLAGGRCQLLVAKIASALWINLVLKQRDAVMGKVKDSISFESFMDLRNARLCNLTELFPSEILEKAVVKSSRVLHDEVIRNAVSQDKQNACLGHLQSLHTVRQLPLPRRPPRLHPLCLAGGRERSFDGFSPPSELQVGGVLRRHWRVWQSFGSYKWTVAVLQQGYRVPFHHLPLVLLEHRELVLLLGVSSCASALGGGRQDAPEGCSGAC